MAGFQVKNFGSIVASMINTMRGLTLRITDYNIGSVVRTMLEAVAIEVEELYFQTFRGLIEATEFIYIAFNFPRRPATKAVGIVTFTAPQNVATDVTIPAGTLVTTDDNIVFETTEDAIMLAGTDTIDGSIRALNVGTDGNVAANAITQIATPINQITGVTNAAATAGGEDAESREERRGRFAEFIASLSRATRIALEFFAKERIDDIVFSRIIENERVLTLVEDESAGTFTTAELNLNINDPFGSAPEIFPSDVTINDAVYFGAKYEFDFIIFTVTTPGTVNRGDGVWEYFDGSTWTAIPSITDDTDKFRFRADRQFVSWIKPADFTYTRVNNILRFWIRFRVTDADYPIIPKVTLGEIRPTRGFVEMYIQNAVGDAPVELLQASQNAVDIARAAGIVVSVFPPVKINVDVDVTLTIDPIFDKEAIILAVNAAITNFLTLSRIGEIIYEAEICQLVMNHNDTAILDVDINTLKPTALPSAPAVDDVFIGLNQIARAGTISVAA